MRALEPKEKRLLVVLGGVLLVMACGYGSKDLGQKGGSAAARRNAPVRSSSTASGALAARSEGARALTPGDIPLLSRETARRLRSGRGPKVGTFTDDQLRDGTSPFLLPLELTEAVVERQRVRVDEHAQAAARYAFRGVTAVSGRAYAVIERSDRAEPWLVAEGERLADTTLVLQALEPSGRSVELVDLSATRDRDRLVVLPYGGEVRHERLGAAPCAPTTVPATPGRRG